MTPVERAARAIEVEICRQHGDGGEDSPFVSDGQLHLGDEYSDIEISLDGLARAVIEAIREPSEGMAKLYYEKGGPRGEAEYGMEKHLGDFVRDAWPAMIDALLAEGE